MGIDDILDSIAAIFMILVMIGPLFVMIDERREIRRANRMKESEEHKEVIRLKETKKQMEVEQEQFAREQEQFAREKEQFAREKEEFAKEKGQSAIEKAQVETLKSENKRKDKLIQELSWKLSEAESKIKRYQNIIRDKNEFDEKRKFEFENNQKVALRVFKKSTLEYQNTYKIFQSITNGRMNNAFDTDLYIKNLDITAEIGSGDHYYKGVTLTKCECEDFKHTKSPCKHMLFLIYSLGVLQMYKEECYKRDNWIQDIYALQGQKKELENKIKSAKDIQKNVDKRIRILQKSYDKAKKELQELIEKKCSAYPIFAAMYADVYTYYYDLAAQSLRDKPRPAVGEALRIVELRKHTREHIKEKKELEYKLGAIRQIYPEVDKIFNNDFDVEDPPVLIPKIKNRPMGRYEKIE